MRVFFRDIVFKIVGWQSRLVLNKYKPRIVAITGSVGKTSTKDAIYHGLSSVLYAAKSQKSYNSEIGIPLAILGKDSGWGSIKKWFQVIIEGFVLILLPNHYPKWLILEAGVDKPGDMDMVVKSLKTDVVVMTKFSKVPVHVEFFKSPEDVMHEKKKLINSLKPGGLLILNADDEDILKIKQEAKKRAVTYGFSHEADVRASHLEIRYEESGPKGITFRVNIESNSYPVYIEGSLGEQHVYPVLATIAIGKALDLNIVKVVNTFSKYKSAPGRMRILDGIYQSTIIDDSYNSSPIALRKALEVLRDTRAERKMAILGDMAELGEYSQKAHLEAGQLASDIADLIIAVGPKAAQIGEGAVKNGFNKSKISSFEDSNEAAKVIPSLIRKNDLVLIKGSQSIRLEKMLEKIMARPEEKKWLLVRQEAEWEDR